MKKSEYIQECLCCICKNPFFRRIVPGKLRSNAMINHRSIRPVLSVTCSKRCSREWGKIPEEKRKFIKKQIDLLSKMVLDK